MGDHYRRRPLSGSEFHVRLERLLELEPGLSVTGGARSKSRSVALGASEGDRHRHDRAGVAADLVHDGQADPEVRDRVLGYAKILGLWGVWHDVGQGLHLHTQSVPPGYDGPELRP